MLDFIRESLNFMGQLLKQILEIPFSREFGTENETGTNLGTIIIIVVLIIFIVKFFSSEK